MRNYFVLTDKCLQSFESLYLQQHRKLGFFLNSDIPQKLQYCHMEITNYFVLFVIPTQRYRIITCKLCNAILWVAWLLHRVVKTDSFTKAPFPAGFFSAKVLAPSRSSVFALWLPSPTVARALVFLSDPRTIASVYDVSCQYVQRSHSP